MTLLRRLHPAFAMLLLAATLALRLAVPAGYMPVADEHGIRVEICTGTGKAFVEIDPGSPNDSQPRDPCPFGLGGGPALDAPPPPAVSGAPAALADHPYPGLVAARLIAWRALRPPARGPPALA